MSRDPDARPDGGSTGLAAHESVTLVEDDADAAPLSPAVPDRATICVVGLGYVGLPLATAFDDAGQEVIGYDVDRAKVDRLSEGVDTTGDVGDRRITESTVEFTADPAPIAAAEYVIITVPTPIDDRQNPDLGYVEAAGETVGDHLSPGATVVLESTVVPGTTESVLAPAIESTADLDAGEARSGE
jgi:UDP-N-acetyl-D-galactosamine dehydrogenase